MNKKGIIATLLVIQLILMIVTVFNETLAEKESFSLRNKYQRIASYRLTSSFEDVSSDLQFLKSKNSSNKSMQMYIEMVDNTFSNFYFMNITLNESNVKIIDENNEMIKWGTI